MQKGVISVFTQFGYTPREAAFLALVGSGSGFFLRRHYGQFLQRGRGGLLHQLIRKAQALGHIETQDCGQRRHVYHLKSKRVYRLLGDEESPHRQVKGDEEIRTRLMVLDYLLAHPAKRWLTLESEKLAYFHGELGVPLADLPQRSASGSHEVRYFCDRFPVEADPSVPRFSYFDFGMVTVKAFVRHLEVHRAFFTALGKFELVYVATEDVNFTTAQEAFNKIMLKVNSAAPKTLLPLGVNHLVSFFEAKKLWDINSPLLTGHHVHVLREGEKLYCGAEHERLEVAWKNGQPEFRQVLRQLGEHSPVAGRLRTHLLGASYPLFKQPPRKETLTREAVEVAV